MKTNSTKRSQRSAGQRLAKAKISKTRQKSVKGGSSQTTSDGGPIYTDTGNG